jgi:hypothetical protein
MTWPTPVRRPDCRGQRPRIAKDTNVEDVAPMGRRPADRTDQDRRCSRFNRRCVTPSYPLKIKASMPAGIASGRPPVHRVRTTPVKPGPSSRQSCMPVRTESLIPAPSASQSPHAIVAGNSHPHCVPRELGLLGLRTWLIDSLYPTRCDRPTRSSAQGHHQPPVGPTTTALATHESRHEPAFPERALMGE